MLIGDGAGEPLLFPSSSTPPSRAYVVVVFDHIIIAENSIASDGTLQRHIDDVHLHQRRAMVRVGGL